MLADVEPEIDQLFARPLQLGKVLIHLIDQFVLLPHDVLVVVAECRFTQRPANQYQRTQYHEHLHTVEKDRGSREMCEWSRERRESARTDVNVRVEEWERVNERGTKKERISTAHHQMRRSLRFALLSN